MHVMLSDFANDLYLILTQATVFKIQMLSSTRVVSMFCWVNEIELDTSRIHVNLVEDGGVDEFNVTLIRLQDLILTRAISAQDSSPFSCGLVDTYQERWRPPSALPYRRLLSVVRHFEHSSRPAHRVRPGGVNAQHFAAVLRSRRVAPRRVPALPNE